MVCNSFTINFIKISFVLTSINSIWWVYLHYITVIINKLHITRFGLLWCLQKSNPFCGKLSGIEPLPWRLSNPSIHIYPYAPTYLPLAYLWQNPMSTCSFIVLSFGNQGKTPTLGQSLLGEAGRCCALFFLVESHPDYLSSRPYLGCMEGTNQVCFREYLRRCFFNLGIVSVFCSELV